MKKFLTILLALALALCLTGLAEEEDHWTCYKCGEDNDGGEKCASCGAERAIWTCPDCGKEGNASDACDECDAPRPVLWTCPNCGKVFNSSETCAECGAKHPVWTCIDCGKRDNAGDNCAECGAARPVWTCVKCKKLNNGGDFCDDDSCGAARPAAGDLYVFGVYENEPIEWIVLRFDRDGSLVLLSRCALDSKPFNDSYAATSWEASSLRKWLNDGFLKAAFGADEQKIILETTLKNEDNPVYTTSTKTPPYGDTKDKVWLLSINEVCDYFDKDKPDFSYIRKGNYARKCVPTEYAIAQGIWLSEEEELDGASTCWWWLRSPASNTKTAAIVLASGYVRYGIGMSVDYAKVGVRPAITVQPANMPEAIGVVSEHLD